MEKALVSEILSESHIEKIGFWLGGLHIDSSRFAGLRRAVMTDQIQVSNQIFPAYIAQYDFDLNAMFIDVNLVAGTSFGRSSVVHESVHAIHDLYRAEMTTRLSSEVAAYIAQCLYLRLVSAPNREPGSDASDPELDSVYDLADDIVVQFGLDRQQGVRIPHSAYQPLRQAISRVYLDYRNDQLFSVGVPRRTARPEPPPPSRGGCGIRH